MLANARCRRRLRFHKLPFTMTNCREAIEVFCEATEIHRWSLVIVSTILCVKHSCRMGTWRSGARRRREYFICQEAHLRFLEENRGANWIEKSASRPLIICRSFLIVMPLSPRADPWDAKGPGDKCRHDGR